MKITALREGKPFIGTMMRVVKNPAAVLIAANAGLDMVMYDMEHAPISFETLSDAASLARSAGIECFVRVSELSRGNVSRALDCGASGVMVPLLKSKEEAEQLVAWAKYAPVGSRGLGGRSAHTDYARPKDGTAAFMAAANTATITIAQIELEEAVDNIDAIASTEGLDALLLGPGDLSNSLGYPSQFDHPAVERAIQKVAEAANRHNKIFGMHGSKELLQRWAPYNLTLRMSAMDIDALYDGFHSLTTLREL